MEALVKTGPHDDDSPEECTFASTAQWIQLPRILLNGGSTYGPYDVNQIPLTSNPMPAALPSDPMIRSTPIFDIGAVFWIRSIHRRGPKPPSVSRYTAVTVMLPVVYIHVPLYAIHHFASLFHSTTTSNNLSPKGKSRVLLW